MSKPKDKDWRGIAATLKKRGLLDSIPKEFTRGQKSKLTKLANEFSELIKKPENFVVRKVPKDTQKILKKSGYAVKNGRAIVPMLDSDKNKFQKLTISKTAVTRSGGQKSEKVYLVGNAAEMMKKAVSLNSSKKRNQVVSFKFGGYSVSSQHYIGIEAMREYLQNVILPRVTLSKKSKADKKQATDQFWSSVSIVTIGELKNEKAPTKSRKSKNRSN